MSSDTTTIARPPIPPPARGTLDRLRTYKAMADDLIGFVGRRFESLGDMYYVPSSAGGLYVMRHPEHFRDVLVTNAECYSKEHSAFVRLSRVLGQGLLNTDGETWRRQRRMIQPAFHKARLASYARMMVEEASAMAAQWQHGQTIDLGAEMTRLTLTIVSRALFSHEVSDDVGAITRAVTVLQEAFSAPPILPRWIPTPLRVRSRLARRAIDRVMYRLIAARRGAAPPGEDADLLQRLIDARDEAGDGRGLSDEEIRDQLVTFFLAGHETTSHALTWTFYLLSRNPDVATAMHDELNAVLGNEAPGFEACDALPFTERVVKESMRIFPPVYAIARKAVTDNRVGGYTVPAGSEVGLWFYQAHHDPRWFEEPERFDPDRFADPAAIQRMKNAYLPFGLGARTCIGKTFATIDAVLLLATITQRWRLSLAPEQQVAISTGVTLMPKYGMRMVLEAR